MILYPAIDLMDGKCVRLTGGDFNARTDYSDDPLAVAGGFKEAGAEWLHLVDLSGARDPAARQKKAIAALAQNASLKIQTGGGIRSMDDVREILDLGVQRVIIGSLCIKDPDTTWQILDTYGPDKIVLALDVHGDFENGFFVATAGWKEKSGEHLQDIIELYLNLVDHILCTDISRDGKLAGPNTDLYRCLCDMAPQIKFQASGGVSSLADLETLKACGAAGVIVGKAIYEKKFTVVEALKAVS